MNAAIAESLTRFLDQYALLEKQEAHAFQSALQDVFRREDSFMDKAAAMDGCFDDYPAFEPLRELCFDLLLMNFFSSDVERLEGDYLESEEWEHIEEQTLERGTELLNVLLYIRECKDEGIVLDLSDFLKEFLLVDEDEFQDEHRIYEPVITHQVLVDSPFAEIARVQAGIDPQEEIAELFYPLMGFFNTPDPEETQVQDFIAHSTDPAFDSAVYRLLITYSQH